MVSVLFVCLGNICRSPTAEGVFRAQVEAAGLADEISVDSAGTGAFHVGEPPDRRSAASALRRGYDLSIQRARQVKPDDLESFDYVLAMDRQNLANLKRLGRRSAGCHLGLFLDFAEDAAEREVPDPYYGGPSGFDHVLDLIEGAGRGLLRHIREKDLGAPS